MLSSPEFLQLTSQCFGYSCKKIILRVEKDLEDILSYLDSTNVGQVCQLFFVQYFLVSKQDILQSHLSTCVSNFYTGCIDRIRALSLFS